MKRITERVVALLLILIMAITNATIVNAAIEAQDSELIPIRATFESLGAEVGWSAEDRSITVVLAGNTLVLFADSQSVYVNNEAATLQEGILLADGLSFIHPDDYLYTLMLLMGLDAGGHLSETLLEANLLAPILMELFSVPGMIVAVVDVREDFAWIQGFGYTDTEQNIPVNENTVFGIASVSKSVTAIAIMQLVENGIMDLDTPIVEYLPDFSLQLSTDLGGDYRNITTRMLLTHTAGILTQFDITSIFDYDYFSLEGHSPDFMNLFLENLAQYYLESPEGEVFSYSNNGYVLLGILVAAMTGNDNFFDDFVRYADEHIFVPAGMTRSSFILRDYLMPHLATPHWDADTPDEYIFPNGLPTGSMVSTGYDMARLMRILLNDDGGLLAAGTVGLMMQPHDFDFSDAGFEYGLGFAHFATESELTAIGHNGQWHHFNAYMLFDAESGLGVFVANNSFTGYDATSFMALTLLQIAAMERSGR